MGSWLGMGSRDQPLYRLLRLDLETKPADVPPAGVTWLLACLSEPAIVRSRISLIAAMRLLGLGIGGQSREFSHCYKSMSAHQLFDFDRRFVAGALEAATGFAALHLFSSTLEPVIYLVSQCSIRNS